MSSEQEQPEDDLLPASLSTTKALEYWRKKLAEETQKQFINQQPGFIPDIEQQETDPPGLIELAQQLDQIKFNLAEVSLEDDVEINHAQLSQPETGTPGENFISKETTESSFLRPPGKKLPSWAAPSIDQDLKLRAKQLLEPHTKTLSSDAQVEDNIEVNSQPEFSFKFVPPVETTANVEENPQFTAPLNFAQRTEKTKADQHTIFNTPAEGSFSVKHQASTSQEVQPFEQTKVSKSGQGGVPLFVFMLLLFYSSIVTLLCVHYFLESTYGNPQELESLPDVVPIIKDGQAVYHLVPEGRRLPNGHMLSLNETRQFGNILVTPLKVTYGPIEFEHYSSLATQQKEPSSPAYKLWLKLTNVSKEQTFAPLDRILMLSKVADKNDPNKLRSNFFLSPAGALSDLAKHHLVFDLPSSGDWSFKHHPDEFTLKPGMMGTIYIPTEPAQAPAMPTDMIWRVQLRKGYHSTLHHGVTTLVDIKFNTKDVELEQPAT